MRVRIEIECDGAASDPRSGVDAAAIVRQAVAWLVAGPHEEGTDATLYDANGIASGIVQVEGDSLDCGCCGASLSDQGDGSPWHKPDEDCRAVRCSAPEVARAGRDTDGPHEYADALDA